IRRCRRLKEMRLDMQLRLRPLQARVGELVEPVILEAADVGHEPDLDRRLVRLVSRTARPAGDREHDACDHDDRKRKQTLLSHSFPSLARCMRPRDANPQGAPLIERPEYASPAFWRL